MSDSPSIRYQTDRNLALELVRVTEAAALAASRWMGLGKKEEAIKTYQEMLSNPKLTDFTESTQARQRLQALGAG